jgi:hypothetical protein
MRIRLGFLSFLALGSLPMFSPALAQRNLTPQKTTESEAQADKTEEPLTYDQAIQRYGIPKAERNLASGKVISQWERSQALSGRGAGGNGAGAWQQIDGGRTLVMVCTFNEKGILEKQTFNFGPSFGSEQTKRRKCEVYFKME